MPDRTINFGESETEATYQIQDTDGAAGGGNFVVAKDTNANTVLLEYQPGSDTWQYAGDVDMNGGNVSGVGTLTANSLNTDESVTVTTGEASNTLHYGSNQDRANAGDNSVALGIGARANGDDGAGGSISNHVAVGYRAAQNNTGFGVTASGREAAQSSTGNDTTAVGYQAAQINTGNRLTAVGYLAAQNNAGGRPTAVGYQAAQNNTGDSVTATGYAAAVNNAGGRLTAVGYLAAQNNTGTNVIAAGYEAARGDGLTDPTTMGDNNIGIGASAIRNNQASGLIAIGQEAGIDAQTDDQLIITQRDGTRRMVMDLTTGDLSITGSLTENATL